MSSTGAVEHSVGVEEQPVVNHKTGYQESNAGLRATSTSVGTSPFCLSPLVTPSLDIDAMCLRIIASTKLLAAIDPRLGAKVVEYASSLSTELHKSSSTTPAMYATLSNIDSNDSGNTATTPSTQAVQPSSAATISLSNNEPAGMNPLQNWTVEQLGKISVTNPIFWPDLNTTPNRDLIMFPSHHRSPRQTISWLE